MDKKDHFYMVDLETKQMLPTDIATWSKWLETADRTIKTTELSAAVFVSTAFLGMAYAFEDGEPLLFATVVTGGAMNGLMNRYTTWEQAVAGHHEIVGTVLLADMGNEAS